jgi:hypothetical protein
MKNVIVVIGAGDVFIIKPLDEYLRAFVLG